jgi:ABC-type Fe3+-hydroxamate transport system substrate-binding protein
VIPPARAILAAGVLVLVAGAAPAADTRSVTDSAGRRVEVPARVERVYAAGGPASILLWRSTRRPARTCPRRTVRSRSSSARSTCA